MSYRIVSRLPVNHPNISVYVLSTEYNVNILNKWSTNTMSVA